MPAQRWWIQLIKGPIATGTFNIPIRVYYDNVLTNELTFPASQLVFTKKGCRLLTPNTTVQLPIANLHHFSGSAAVPGRRPSTSSSTATPMSASPIAWTGCRPPTRCSRTAKAAAWPGAWGATAQGRGRRDALVLGPRPPPEHRRSRRLQRDPLIARYYQVEPTVSPGAVITTATLTLFYE